MRKMPKLVDLLFERPKKNQSNTNKEKGQSAARDYRSAIKNLESELPSVLSSPGNAKKFLNGPGKDPKVRAVIGRGHQDGLPSDEEVNPSLASPAVKGLKPTQREIEFGKSVGWPLADFATMKKCVAGNDVHLGKPGEDTIVTSGDLVIDGHHRWSSLYSVSPGATIAAWNLDLPTSKAGQALAMAQLAIGATLQKGQEVESSSAGKGNILTATEDQIYNMVKKSVGVTVEKNAGEILGEQVVKKFIADQEISKHFGLESGGSVDDAREKIAKTIARNLSNLPDPAKGAPPRVDMPQLDTAAGGVEAVVKKLDAGEVNFREPMITKRKNESTKSDDQLVMERWMKLSGLLKD